MSKETLSRHLPPAAEASGPAETSGQPETRAPEENPQEQLGLHPDLLAQLRPWATRSGPVFTSHTLR